jgi:N-acetylglutamate synthase-like GNAT family acetyltransferase
VADYASLRQVLRNEARPVVNDLALSIRRAGADDLPAINALVQSSSAYSGEYRAMIDTYAVTAAQAERDEIHLAEDQFGLAGFYSLKLGDDPELDLMFVADRCQGQGTGRVLFEHMRALARQLGLRAVKIVSHPPSVGFYRRMGAIETGTQPAAGRITWDRPVLMLPCDPATLDDSTP